MTFHNTPSVSSDLQTGGHNVSVPKGCMEFRFSELEFLPWNNPDNIVSEEVEINSRKFKFVMQIILFVLGGPANIINMAVFYKQGLKDRVNLLLFSLSLADEIFLIMSFLLHVEEFHIMSRGNINPGPLLKFIVNNNLGCIMATSFVSIVLSAIIACERCYCVLRPLKYQTLLRTRTMAAIIIAVYVVVIGLNFIAVFRYHFGCVYDPNTDIVSTMYSQSEFYIRHMDFIDNVDNIFFGAGLPVLVAVVVVTATAITTSKLRETVAWRAETSSSLSPREVALTKMLVGTSVLLIVCVFPSCLFRVACLFLPEVNPGRRHQNFYWACFWITELFLFINSSFNVCIYYVMGTRYRETFWALFSRNEATTK